ncbi:MAG TPA: hypothetical protein VIV07_09255, partial [Sphingomicrobium sp.]
MSGVAIALALLAQSATAAAAPPPPAQPAQPASAPAKPDDACSPGQPKPSDTRTIVICAQRPNGYRLNPDVGEAKREAHSGGRPTSPYGQPRPDC